MPANYWAYLGFTILIEVLVVVILVRWSRLTLRRAGECYITSIGLNLISHPVAWIGLHQFGVAAYWPIEIGVILFEALGFRVLLRWNWTRAFTVSAIANVVTLTIGWLM